MEVSAIGCAGRAQKLGDDPAPRCSGLVTLGRRTLAQHASHLDFRYEGMYPAAESGLCCPLSAHCHGSAAAAVVVV